MHPMNESYINEVLNNLNQLGTTEYLVLSKETVANLQKGTFRTKSGGAVEATVHNRSSLSELASKNPDNFIAKIDKWMAEGRLAGKKEGPEASYVFRANIADLLGPEVTIKVRVKDPSVKTQETYKGRVQSISEEDYDTMKEAIDAIKSSLEPVETQQTEKKERRPEREFTAHPLAQRRERPASARETEKKPRKEHLVASHGVELERQQEAKKKKRKEEQEKIRKQHAKENLIEEIQDFRIEQEDIDEDRKRFEK